MTDAFSRFVTPLSHDEIRTLRDRALAEDRPTDWFEPLYVAAEGDSNRVPWAIDGAHPALKSWISERPVSQLFDFSREMTAIVVGCGLGDDAEAIARLGFRVTAFDVSPCAIGWCHERFEQSCVDYRVADLLELDPDWLENFDFVFENRTIQALPLSVRTRAIDAVAKLVAPGRRLVVVTHTRTTETNPDGPPWPLSPSELDRFTQRHDLQLEWQRDFQVNSDRPRQCLEFARPRSPLS